MIFVTVGSSLPYNELVRAIDQLVADGVIVDRVVCQIGDGTYKPRHCEYFRFKPSLEEDVRGASLVIGHGGTGTVTGLLASGKPFVAVPNPFVVHNHQEQFLARLSKEFRFLWTADLSELPRLIEQARTFTPKAASGKRLTTDLAQFLLGEAK